METEPLEEDPHPSPVDPCQDADVIDADFDQALDLRVDERLGFLRRLPPNRRHAVSELLRLAELSGPLDRQLGELAGHLLDVASADVDERVDGREIGSWRIIRRLGAGGMGVVYLVERVDEGFEQRAALKVIRWELADPSLVRRFVVERQILANLSHPHIASLIDGGVTDQGLPYLVLEYVEGEPIDAYCDARKLDTSQRLELMTSVCRAVDFAHRQLVVHRDLKPSNILVRADGVPKLLDFGVAKLLSDTPAEVTQHAPMTPRYAAPEQRLGERVSVAADIWSLGRVLAELLCGRQLTEDELGISGSPPGVPGGFGGARCDLGHDDLTNIVGLALRSDPQERYRSAEDLATDLDSFMAQRPVLATAPSLRYRLGKLIARHRAAAAALVVALLVAVLGVLGVLWKSQEARKERDIAQLQALQAKQTKDFLRSLFAGAAPRLGEELRARDLLDQGAERINTELADTPAVRAELLATLGDAYKWLLDFDRSERLLLEALEVQESLAPGGPGHAAAIADLGGLELHRGDAASAGAYFEQALAMLAKSTDASESHLGSLLNSLGMARQGLGDAEGALDPLQRSVQIFADLGGDEEAMARGNLGLALDNLGRHEEAEAEHRAAIEIYHRLSPNNSTIAVVMTNLAMNLAAQRRLDEAKAVIEESVELHRDSTLPGSGLAIAEANLANLMIGLGRSAEAVQLAERSAARLEELTPESTSLIATRANLGWALALEGELDRSRVVLEHVVLELEQRFGSEHSSTARGRSLYGAVLVRAGRFGSAEEALTMAIKSLEASGASTVRRADAWLPLGSLYCATDRAQEGLNAVEQAIQGYEASQGHSKPADGEAQDADLGLTAWPQALAHIERANCLEVLDQPWDRDGVTAALDLLVRARGEDAWGSQRGTRLLRLNPPRE